MSLQPTKFSASATWHSHSLRKNERNYLQGANINSPEERSTRGGRCFECPTSHPYSNKKIRMSGDQFVQRF